MMLFKLSLKNIRKSFKDYAIYFMTLILGVTIFYMFNSIESQEAMMQVNQSQKMIIELMTQLIGFVSGFVAIILAFLIIYANNFLIKRRKKEFGIYMTLGMGKRQISKILLFETILIGIISLGIGLVIGIFGSQLMSILVSKLFEVDMTEFQFIFSKDAFVKTCIYFALMYFAVMIFNTISVSRYKLIDLLNAAKKNEKVIIKNPIICTIIFLLSCGVLGYAYYIVSAKAYTLTSFSKIWPILVMGTVATLLLFWSLSGLMIKLIQFRKKTYLKDANMFVLRQINNKINTTVVSMTVICLMLFITITILSTALSIKNTMTRELVEMTPVDINLYKTASLPERYVNRYGEEIVYTKEQIEDSQESVQYTLENAGLDMNLLKDVVEISTYTSPNLTWETYLKDVFDEVKAQFPGLAYGTPELIVKESEYNKVAKLYGLEEFHLNDNEYVMLCDFDNMVNIRNKELQIDGIITLCGKEYTPKYKECKSGYIMMSTSHTNTGIILVPDSCPLTKDMQEQQILIANYNATTDEQKQEIENLFASDDSILIQNLDKNGIDLEGATRISIYDGSVGIATIIVFLAIYLGIIFLISSSAVLALKQLTESSDNKLRYSILRKIGADDRMINHSLFLQIGIFFAFPIIIAMIHSIFGIQFALSTMSGIADAADLLPSIIATVVIIGFIYGIYFLATYFESKNIIKENI